MDTVVRFRASEKDKKLFSRAAGRSGVNFSVWARLRLVTCALRELGELREPNMVVDEMALESIDVEQPISESMDFAAGFEPLPPPNPEKKLAPVVLRRGRVAEASRVLPGASGASAGRVPEEIGPDTAPHEVKVKLPPVTRRQVAPKPKWKKDPS